MTIYVNDIVIFKASYNMNDGRNLTDMTEKFISKTFSFWSPFN